MKNHKETPAMINPRYGHAGFIAKTGLANSSVKYIVGFGKNKMGANSYSETLEYWSMSEKQKFKEV
jgi:hypothetical protein